MVLNGGNMTITEALNRIDELYKYSSHKCSCAVYGEYGNKCSCGYEALLALKKGEK